MSEGTAAMPPPTTTTSSPPAGFLTSEVARRLNVAECRLRHLVKSKRIAAPAKVGRCAVWSDADIEAAKAILEGANRD
jgi:hypothetical protein